MWKHQRSPEAGGTQQVFLNTTHGGQHIRTITVSSVAVNCASKLQLRVGVTDPGLGTPSRECIAAARTRESCSYRLDGGTHATGVRAAVHSEQQSRDVASLCGRTRFNAAAIARRAMTSMLGFHDSQARHVFGPRAGMCRSWTELASHVSRPLTHVTDACWCVRSV